MELEIHDVAIRRKVADRQLATDVFAIVAASPEIAIAGALVNFARRRAATPHEDIVEIEIV